jgi:uncharacterized protein YeaO (DUF488 family)
MELLTTAIDVYNGWTITAVTPTDEARDQFLEMYVSMEDIEEQYMTELQREELYMARWW